MDGATAAGGRSCCLSSNPVASVPIPGRPDEFVSIENVTVQGVQYYEADQGYLVVEYTVVRMGGDLKGQRATSRVTSLKTLDGERSAGL